MGRKRKEFCRICKTGPNQRRGTCIKCHNELGAVYRAKYKSEGKISKICIRCSNEFKTHNRNLVCNICKNSYYRSPEYKSRRSKKIINNIVYPEYTYKWIAKRIDNRYWVNNIELMELIGIYYDMGGLDKWINDEWNVGKQYSEMWLYVKGEFDKKYPNYKENIL